MPSILKPLGDQTKKYRQVSISRRRSGEPQLKSVTDLDDMHKLQTQQPSSLPFELSHYKIMIVSLKTKQTNQIFFEQRIKNIWTYNHLQSTLFF